MALTVTTSLVGKTFYSYDLDEIKITTNKPYVRVQLKVQEQIVFTSTYYAVGTVVCVRNLSSLFESVMEQMRASLLVFTLIANDNDHETTIPFSVLYCRDRIMDIPASDFLNGYFLTTNLNRLTTMHNVEQLWINLPYSSNYNNVMLDIATVIRLPDGSIVDYTYLNQQRVGSGLVYISVSAASVQDNVRCTYPGCTLLYFKVTHGSHVCRFYVQPCPSAEVFQFRNNFGCMETVAFPAVTTSKLESEFSEAKVNGQLSHYDVRHSRTYDVETPSLLASQMTWLEQFVTSYYVVKMVDNLPVRVLIKDYDFEQSNAPGAENKLSFTWQFADGRQTPHRISLRTGIFTEPFNDTFA